MQLIWTILNKNAHTYEKRGIEIDERGNIQDILSDTIGKILRFLWRFIIGNVDTFSSFGSQLEYLPQLFKIIIPVPVL